MPEPEQPSFRDLYELVDDKVGEVDGKVEKMSDRLSRMEKGFIVLTLIVVYQRTPGAPSPADLVAGVVKFFG